METLDMKEDNLSSLIESNEEDNVIYSTRHPCSLSLRIRTFVDPKEYDKFIKTVEKMVRTSSEYREWKNYIIEVLQVNTCSVSNESIEDCSIEIHHHIPSLYVLVKGIINKYLDEGKEFCTFDICVKCIELHFKNKVGFVPLIKSLHEKFHKDKLQIPSKMVMGDYKWLLDNYRFDQEDLELINARLQLEQIAGCAWRRDDYPGYEKLPSPVGQLEEK